MPENNQFNMPDLDYVSEVAKMNKKIADGNEDICHLRDIISESADKTNNEEDIKTSTESFRVKPDGKPDFSHSFVNNELKEADLALHELDKLDEINESKMNENAIKTAEAFDLTEEEATNIAQILIAYKNDKKMNVYKAMIPSMKLKINNLCMQSSIPLDQVGFVARMFMDQFLKNASVDEEFIDIEKTIEKSLKIPSLVDIYMEHINDTMDVKLPAMAEAIMEREPERAEAILKIRDEYNAAFLCSRLRKLYDTNSRIRKLIRRDWSDNAVKHLADEANFHNSRTKFKMPDCSVIPSVLKNIIAERENNCDAVSIPEWREQYVNKFCMLLFMSASYLDLNDINDAAFYYYSVKNLSMMAYLGDKMSDFSAELISNVYITMLYINRREADFNAKNIHKSEGKRKRSVRNRMRS